MYLDLSHRIDEQTTVYPGTEPPQIQVANTIERDGFAELRVSFYSHTGTHIDAPCHILPGTRALDDFPVNQFIGQALVVDCRAFIGQEITLDFLQSYQKAIEKIEFILLRADWSAHWTSATYFEGYPTLSREAAEWLVQFPLKGIGLDMISIDRVDASDLPIHHIVLAKEILIIENLCRLDQLPPQFLFQCLPLPIRAADGAPVRAIAQF